MGTQTPPLQGGLARDLRDNPLQGAVLVYVVGAVILVGVGVVSGVINAFITGFAASWARAMAERSLPIPSGAAPQIPRWLTLTIGDAFVVGFVLRLIRRLDWSERAGIARPGLGAPWLWLAALIPAACLAVGLIPGATRASVPPEIWLWLAVVAVAEELLSRGVVLGALMTQGTRRAVVVSSVGFGLSHLLNLSNGNNWVVVLQIGVAMCSGALWAAVRIRAGTVWPGVLGHFAVDIVIALFATNLALLSATHLVIVALASAASLAMAIALLRGVPQTITTPSRGAPGAFEPASLRLP